MVRVARWGWPGLVLPLLIICWWCATAAYAFDLELSIGSGYDDNPRQEKGSAGALFTEAELDFEWILPLPKIPATSISLFGFAGRQLYSGLDDNWQLGGGLLSATRTTGLPGSFNLFSSIAGYRNPLISDNDYDTLNLGTSFTWFTSPRLNLELESTINWETYCDEVINGGHKPNNGNHHLQGKGNNNSPQHHNSGDRNDRLFTTALKSFYAFTPDFDGTGEIFWRHRHSSIDAECRSAYGLNLNCNWRPFNQIAFNLGLGAERLPYKYRYQRVKRTEKIYNFNTGISWDIRNFTLLASWDWDKRDSTISEDKYQRNIWQIRLKYSY